MFGRIDKTTMERTQNVHDDEVIESKIKECQRENGQCMVSTSRRLRQTYGDERVNRVLRRLSARRYRNNKNNRDTLHNVLDRFSI
jgi:replicative superfamily II helicase